MLLVDAANVVGSRPNGWWHDRAGAARKLVEDVRAATASGLLDPPVVVVLEGAARRGVPVADGDVRVVHAAGSGDDTLVDLATESSPGSVVVVTADRALRRRLQAVGADSFGPSWLLDRTGQRRRG